MHEDSGREIIEEHTVVNMDFGFSIVEKQNNDIFGKVKYCLIVNTTHTTLQTKSKGLVNICAAVVNYALAI